MSRPAYDVHLKILLIGDSGVGKTSVLFRFSDDVFRTNWITTIGIDFKIKTVTVNGLVVKLQLWDTAGQERFNTLTRSYYSGADGVLLVYDITDSKSFENIGKWMHNLDDHARDDIVKMIIGNKCDLKDKRVVSTDLGKKISTEYGIRFHETSAKTNTNIEYIFFELAEEILAKKSISRNEQPKDIVRPASVESNSFENYFKGCCQI